jgi:hypothetical protein
LCHFSFTRDLSFQMLGETADDFGPLLVLKRINFDFCVRTFNVPSFRLYDMKRHLVFCWFENIEFFLGQITC